jgi:NAD(P)-dependent dehydrogenase (short-subunit alcohol dehydrogenase family)
MKILVTGGNRGLGLGIVNEFSADGISRQSGFDITQHVKEIAKKSLEYDVFINNAFDGPPQEEWANFAQTNLLLEVYKEWKQAGKDGWIFNIGSIGEKSIVAPDPDWETYRVSKSALKHASQQCTRAFKDNKVKFKTTLISPDRLDTELSRSRDNWTGNGIQTKDIIDFIKYSLTVNPNTVIEEVTFYCGLDYSA